MSAKFFVDASILVYAHDRSTGAKHDRASRLVQELWASGAGVLSVQVLQELCVNMRRKAARPLSIEETQGLLRDYLSWEIVVNDGQSILEALALQEQFSLTLRDALVIQAAEKSGAEIIYSEDLADGQAYGSVRVLNPLLSATA